MSQAPARPTLPVLLLILLAPLSQARAEFIPGAGYDPSIPSLEQVVGHGWGERITTHGESERYLFALRDASGGRMQLFQYGRSWEGRKLYYAVIATPERIARLEQLKEAFRALADPLSLDSAHREAMLDELPVVTWLAANIHGNEPSSTDAVLWLARHLLASRGDTLVERIFEESVVVIDPSQNPDGRDRFIAHFRENTGRWPASEPWAAERREDWPGGRTNHYLFDMNRDWYAQTQQESRGRVQVFLQWRPHVYVDLHEMGSDRTYYFPPTAPPTNPQMSDEQVKWFAEFGRNNARWFDRFGFLYYTGESFDAYFPGYGCTWPSLNGAVGMTYEQASSRGLVALRSNETEMPYSATVRHHAVASLATAGLAAAHRREILEDFLATRTPPEDIPDRRAYIITEEKDPSRTGKLVGKLLSQGIEVRRSTEGFQAGDLVTSDRRNFRRRSFPAGTFIVPAHQAAHALAANLLEPEMPMSEEYVAEQERRLAAGLPPQVYDITAWSLPVFYGVDCYRAESLGDVQSEPVETLFSPASASPGQPGLAWIMDNSTNSALAAAADLLRSGVRLYFSDKAFSQQGRDFSRGSLIIPVRENPDTVGLLLERVAAAHGVEMVPAESAWMSEGVNFGSPNVHYLPEPSVLLAWDEPCHPYSAGWARYVLERQYGVPVTAVKTGDIGRAELHRYNVLVLPNGWDFGNRMGKQTVEKVKAWIAGGGTLVALHGAVKWLATEEAGLLPSAREYRLSEDSAAAGEKEQEDEQRAPGSEIVSREELERVINREDMEPRSVPGVLARITLDPDHWLTAGCDTTAVTFVQGYDVYRPLKRSEGRNVAYFAGGDNLLVSGYAWRGPALRQLAYKPYLMYRSYGRGHVIAFTEDPNFRAVVDGMNRLFLNAVLAGPGH